MTRWLLVCLPPIRRKRFLTSFARAACLTLGALLASQTVARARNASADFDIVDGPVYAVAQSGNTLYLGGDFRRVGPQTMNAVGLSAATGKAMRIPNVDGDVYAIAADGSGGWYIGGHFHHVGGVPRERLARIMADGSLSQWNPMPGYDIYAIAVSGSTVYVGGHFVTIGNSSLNHLAAIDAITGLATSWNPNFGAVQSTSVNAIVVRDGVVYAGGDFTIFGPFARNYLVAVDSSNGQILPWNPNANAPVLSLVMNGSTLYAGGPFTRIGGQFRNHVAAVDVGTGSTTSWDPNPDGDVRALGLIGSTICVAGSFGNIGGQPRSHIATLDSTTANATAWSPNACCGSINALHVAGPTIYVGGSFDAIGGQSRRNLAALDAATGAVTAWDPGCSGVVNAIAMSNSIVYAGGLFQMSGGKPRNRLAAIDLVTHRVTDWDPNVDGAVRALALGETAVYAAGSFDSVGIVRRRFLAAIDAATAVATPWNPSADGSVRALALNGATLYAGGTFKHIGGQPRVRIAAVDTGTGLATPWISDADSTVRVIAIADSVVYAGGSFGHIGGQDRSLIAALDVTTGEATDWNPSVAGFDPDVYAIAVDNGVVYVGGDFLSAGGQTRQNIAGLDARTGLATDWSASSAYTVYALALGGALPDASVVYAGGEFMAAFDAASGSPTAWHPSVGGVIYALTATLNRVYAGGDFTFAGDIARSGIAVLEADRSTPTLLSLFAAEPAEDGIVLRWELAEPERAWNIWLERSVNASGPWDRLASEIRNEGRVQTATDRDVAPGRSYWYRLHVEIGGRAFALGPVMANAGEPFVGFALSQIVPTPTAGTARIEFTVARESRVRLVVLDVQGRVVATLLDANRRPGRYQALWNGEGGHGPARSGAYFVLYETAEHRTTKRLIMSR